MKKKTITEINNLIMAASMVVSENLGAEVNKKNIIGVTKEKFHRGRRFIY